MSASQATRWWWVRHAPVTEAGDRIYGQDDVSCDTTDSTSFQALARTLPTDAVWVTSTLCRTAETLAAIAAVDPPRRLPKAITEPDFMEQSFGEWQETSWDALAKIDGADYRQFWQNPAMMAPPGGESFDAVMRRTGLAIHRLNTEYPGRDIVAIAHGGTIRSAVGLALGSPPERTLTVKVDTLSLTRIDHHAEGWRGMDPVSWRVVSVNQRVT